MSFVVNRNPFALVAAAVLAALLVPGVVAAQGPPVSAVSQYVEQVPTSDGSATVGVGRSKRSGLPPAARMALAAKPAVTSTPLAEICDIVGVRRSDESPSARQARAPLVIAHEGSGRTSGFRRTLDGTPIARLGGGQHRIRKRRASAWPARLPHGDDSRDGRDCRARALGVVLHTRSGTLTQRPTG